MFRNRKKGPIFGYSEIENLLSLVSYFDSVRDGHFHTPKDIEVKTKNIKNSKKHLKYARDVIDKTLSAIKTTPGSLSLKIRVNELMIAICILYAASFAILMSIYITGGIPSFLSPLVSIILNPTSMTFIGLLLAIYIVLRSHIKSKVRIAAKQYLKRSRTDVRMKKVIQYYLDLIPRALRKKKIKDPSNVLFELFYNDYDGIKIIKEPRILSDTFTVSIDMKKARNRVSEMQGSRL